MKNFFKNSSILVNKKGIALILSILVVVVFSVLGMTLLAVIVGVETDIWIKELASGQAFYRAESGRNYFLEYVVSHDTDFMDSAIPNTTITKQLGTGEFSIEYSNKEAKTADMKFSGKTGDITRSITQSFDGWAGVPLAFKFALFIDDPEISPDPDVDLLFESEALPIIIEGDVYIRDDARFISKPNKARIGNETDFDNGIRSNLYSRGNVDIETTNATFSYFEIWGDVFLGDDSVFSIDNGQEPPAGSIPCTCPSGPCTIEKPNNIKGDLFCGDSFWPPAYIDIALPTYDPTYYDQEISIAQNHGVNGGGCRFGWPAEFFASGENKYCQIEIDLSHEIRGGTAAEPDCPINLVTAGRILGSSAPNIHPYISLIGSCLSLYSSTLNSGNILYSSGQTGYQFSIYLEDANIQGALMMSPLANKRFNESGEPTITGIFYPDYIQEDGLSFVTINGSFVLRTIVEKPSGFGTAIDIRDFTIDHINHINHIPLAVKGLYNIQYTAWEEQ